MSFKIDLKGYRGFALQYDDTSKEATVITLCAERDIPIERFQNKETVPDDLIPCGSVEWSESILGYSPTPDYYPEWVKSHLHRNVWAGDKWILEKRVFVKPADRYKRFTGFVSSANSYKGKKRPPYMFSDVVSFNNEWRYYISNGKILTSGWYDGDQINTPDAPELDVDIPKEFCGAADFGTYDGKLCCIEVQHPYACGWYGDFSNDSLPYVQWLIDGWIYMLKKDLICGI